ncbi:Na/Pi symporter [Aestuariivirga sp.]|uniref:Na/Pi symporter n=1 Tax=Aestuariivirga sp. TaxID=2650926 RepID=UPI003BABDDF4
MIANTLVAFAGLGFFLAGLHMLSEVVRSLAARRLRLALAKLGRLPLSNPIAGSLLGAITQSTSASAFICIGLLNARAIGFPAALSISAWAGVGTALLVFMASIDLRAVALAALSIVGLFYIASLHRSDIGRRTTELLLAAGVTLFGLTMVKSTGHALGDSVWVQEFFRFASESWIYSFLIGFIVTLVMQSSSTVTIIAVTMSATGLIPLREAVVLVCGANVGSGMSVAMISAHLTGLARQLAVWQSVVKLLGALCVLPLALVALDGGPIEARLTQALPVPTLLAITYLVINLLGAVLSGLLRRPLLPLLDRLAPVDRHREQFTPEYIVDEASEDPDTAFLLAQREQARLTALLPAALGLLREEEAPEEETLIGNDARRELSLGLAGDISDFISETVSGHPGGTEVNGLLLLQRCNAHIRSLIDALHGYVSELSSISSMTPQEKTMCVSMTESLHFLLGLAADQGNGEVENGAMLDRLTGDRSDVMTRFRQEILAAGTDSSSNRESLFVATGLFERMVWLVRQISADFGDIAIAGGGLPETA